MSYNKFPHTVVQAAEGDLQRGYPAIVERLKKEIVNKKRFVLAVEIYPGVRDEELQPVLRSLSPQLFIDTTETLCSRKAFESRIGPYLTDDRVFGRMYYGEWSDFQNVRRKNAVCKAIQSATGLVIVYGMGAAELVEPDLILYCDLARWEIQQRFRKGIPNYYTDNKNEDNLKKFKRGYFFEWRLADNIKRRLMDKIDFYLDTNRADDPIMITGDILRQGLKAVTSQPFRLVPYFDPGVWGGQWMKKVCGLDSEKPNYAWAFDGVPEENSLYLSVLGNDVEVPAMNAVLYCPTALLGEQVYARFGAEFPIRFDFLDTMDGQNLSLQVHPLTDYIHHCFGMSYTQDESYYILDAKEDACVYLGIRDGVKPEEMIAALKTAQEGGAPFDAERYVNKLPAKKHDHFLIPAGTVHCSGKNCMVLEISATPYIFTMKLWDWGRLGLDGKPRPIHIEHGSKVIQWDRRTEWVKNNLVDQIATIREDDDFKEEHTGLHELEFIETRRYTVKTWCEINNHNGVSMCNLSKD